MPTSATFKTSGQMSFLEFVNFWYYTSGGPNFGTQLNNWRSQLYGLADNSTGNWPASNMSLQLFYGKGNWTAPSGGGK